MTMWLIRRLLQAALVILAMTVIVFIGVSVIGDPMEMLVAPDATQRERLEVAAALGLDLTVFVMIRTRHHDAAWMKRLTQRVESGFGYGDCVHVQRRP